MTDDPPLTLQQQADLLMYLLRRCVHTNGTVPKETWMLIEAKDYADLMHLERRLRRMAMFEPEIKRLVTQK